MCIQDDVFLLGRPNSCNLQILDCAGRSCELRKRGVRGQGEMMREVGKLLASCDCPAASLERTPAAPVGWLDSTS